MSANPRTFTSLQQAQADLDGWVTDYKTKRPHQALEMATPAERFRLLPVSVDGVSIPVDPAEDHRGQWVLRRVGSNGMVSGDARRSGERCRACAVCLLPWASG